MTVIFTVMNTTYWPVVTYWAENIQACIGVELVTSKILVQQCRVCYLPIMKKLILKYIVLQNIMETWLDLSMGDSSFNH